MGVTVEKEVGASPTLTQTLTTILKPTDPHINIPTTLEMALPLSLLFQPLKVSVVPVVLKVGGADLLQGRSMSH